MKAADGLYWYGCSLSNIFMAKVSYGADDRRIVLDCIKDAGTMDL